MNNHESSRLSRFIRVTLSSFLVSLCYHINSNAIEHQFKYDLSRDEYNKSSHLTQLIPQVNSRPRLSDIAISPDGATLVAGTEQGELRLWNLSGEKREIKRLKGHMGNIGHIKFSPDGRWLASAGLVDNRVLLWNVKDWSVARELDVYREHTDEISTVAFSPDGQYLASGGYDNIVTLSEVVTGKKVKEFSAHKQGIMAISFSPDGKWLASASWDKFVYIWDWQKNLDKTSPSDKFEPTYQLEHPDSVFHINFSPDNKWLVSGGDDRILRLWEVRSGFKLEKQFTEHATWISSAVFSVDGQWLISSAVYGRIEVRDLQSNQLFELKNHDGLISRIIVHPTVKQFIVGMADGNIRFYALPNGELRHLLVMGSRVSDWLSCNFIAQNCLRSKSLIDWLFEFAAVWMLLSFMMAFAVYYYYSVYQHPQAVAMATNSQLLLDLPLTQLPRIKRLLRLSRRFELVLTGCRLSPADIKTAIRFIKGLPTTRTQILAEKLEASVKPQTPDLFTLQLPDSFPINLKECFLYFPPATLPANNIRNKLNWDDRFQSQKVIVITLDDQQQKELQRAENRTPFFIVPDLTELTRWLLAPQPIVECARTIANQIKVAQLSPYQPAGGVDKESNFFGREQIFSHILNRHLANYFIVGGRQIGKTSLLKHLQRHYRKQPELQCYFLSLGDHKLVEKLATTLQLPTNSPIKEVVHHLTDGQRRIFLIDEADAFIQAEAQQDYIVLNHLRGLSEEGHCRFLFAGFWQLYQAATLDYHSPLKNFAETITIAELEREACYDLIVKPLYSLNIKMATEALIDKIIHLTGQRANLIALICHEMLKNLDLTKRVLNETDVTRALDSRVMNERVLEDWKKLTTDEEANRLDRLIVYNTIRDEQFTLASLSKLLKSFGSYPLQQVELSLTRLILSFVIRRQQHYYSYCVPLLREKLLQEDIEELIKWELK